MDRKFVLTALTYAVVGMLLGVYMGASQNHGQFVTHAHVLLLGFVVSFVYGLCHRLWLNNTMSKLARAQFYVHQAATLVVLVCLFLNYGRFVEESRLGPFLGMASVLTIAGMVLMYVLFLKSGGRRTQTG